MMEMSTAFLAAAAPAGPGCSSPSLQMKKMLSEKAAEGGWVAGSNPSNGNQLTWA